MSSRTKFDYDVVIVGGGPAGVSCAISVAQNGHSVVILDKKKRDRIGDKTCGDAIDKAAVTRLEEKLGLAHPSGKEVSDAISKMSIAAEEIDLKLTLDAPGYMLDRLEYGQRLPNIAEELGVIIIDRAPVRGILTDKINGDTYVSGVTYYHGGEQKELTAKFTIDASGAYASVRKELPDELLTGGMKRELEDHEVWPTYREIIKLDESVAQHRWREEIVLQYDEEYPPPGYYWMFTKGDGMLNVGIGWEKTQNLGKLKESLYHELHKHYDPSEYEVVKRGGGQIPFRPPFDNCVFNGGALTGDAACLVHPVTAEGHGPALDTAAELGEILTQALKDGDRSKEAIWDYNLAIAHHYGPKHTEAQVLKEFLVDIGSDGLKFLIEKNIFRNEELNLIFSGGQLKLSFWEIFKRIFKLITKPKMMFGLRRVLNLSDKIEKLYADYPENSENLSEWRIRRNELLDWDM